MNDSFPKQLPPLPYSTQALEPAISAQTLRLHHDKLMAGALANLNSELDACPKYQCWSIERLVGECGRLPFALQTPVRRNGGSVFCHELYFDGMTPCPATDHPTGRLGEAIDRCFGCFEHLWTIMLQAGVAHFGDGWLWLAITRGGELRVFSSCGHDTPLLQGMRPILTADLWEHAYYLDYQNRRADYLSNWKKLIDWDFAEQNYRLITG